MKFKLDREAIAMRTAKELRDGQYVNLGLGIGMLTSNYIPEGETVVFHAENGVLGFGRVLTDEEMDQIDFNLATPGSQYVTPLPGMSFFDISCAMDMVRGGHVDVTVLGALQISEKGDLANWMRPGEKVPVIGGAIDMAVGAKKVIVTMTHTTESGEPKIVKKCAYPLTAEKCVDLIITDVAVIDVTGEGLLLKEYCPGWTVEDIQGITEPKLKVSEELKEMTL